MPLSHILVLGAGPAGLSAALAIAQTPSSPPLRVTVLELRPRTGPTADLGGAVNLTPLAMRYLDRLGVGGRLRPRGVPVASGIHTVALRTGSLLGSLWAGVDALRVRRSDLVACLREAAGRTGGVEIRYGVRVAAVREEGTEEKGEVVLVLDDGEEVRGDILLGCDGLHSAARRLYVEPDRKEVYTGKAAAYGFAQVREPGRAGLARSDGGPAVVDTTMFMGRYGSLLVSFFEEQREKLFVAGVMGMKGESGGHDGRDGWKSRGSDKAHVRGEILRRFGSSRVTGLTELLEDVDDWTLYPVYTLPPGGRWSKGRVLLLGDAAHTMPPIGESTGIAIEDGALIARVLTRHRERTVTQLFGDYEKLRRATIDQLYAEITWRWATANKEDLGWITSFIWEWMTVAFLKVMAWRQGDYFARDVGKLELPA